MYTLIEVFDSKQYENIISPVFLTGISKIIYIGSKEVMSGEKMDDLKSFFIHRNIQIPLEFRFLKRDDSAAIKSGIEEIIQNNHNCVFDATGGEDVMLTIIGLCAMEHSVPVIRTNAKTGQTTLIYGSFDVSSTKSVSFDVSDFICLQGGKIRHTNHLPSLSAADIYDIKTLFKVNSRDCESYSIFCNFASERLIRGGSYLSIPYNDVYSKTDAHKNSVQKTLSLFKKYGLLKQSGNRNNNLFKVKSPVVSHCLKKAGNVLEYYTALAAMSLPDVFRDVKVGTTIEWDNTKSAFETQNEIDVVAVSGNTPVFISCKNGETKKEALYELDTVSRVLGGVYSKKVLVCTYISENDSARNHFIKRARDMNIILIHDVHTKSFDEFLHCLSKVAVISI